VFQVSVLPNRDRRSLWLGLLAVFIALLLAQSAQAMGLVRLQMIYSHLPSQQVDTDGDGRLDSFSATFTVYSDATASGTIFLSASRKIEVRSGQVVWNGGEETALLSGQLYRKMNGQWQLVAPVQAEAEGRPTFGGGDGGDIIVWDIVDSVQPASFEATGVWQRDYVAALVAPASQADTDGDGRPDEFAADVVVGEDGRAAGAIQLDQDAQIVVESGSLVCQGGQSVMVLRGSRTEQINGLWQEVGDSEARGRPTVGSGDGGDIIVWDIVDSFAGTERVNSFAAPGEMPVMLDPCNG
jgi:hypothetical protein